MEQQQQAQEQEEFGLRLRKLRGKTSQRDLASKLNWSKSVISRIETGQQLPSEELCKAYEKLFDLPTGTILGHLNRLERGEWNHPPLVGPQQDDPSQRDRADGSGPRRLPWAALVVVLSGLAVANWLIPRNEPEPRLQCVDVGGLNGELAARPDAAELERRFLAVYEMAGTSRVGCASDLAYRWQALMVQEFALDGVPNGAILLLPNGGSDLYLNRAAWGSYHQLAGFSGNMAQTLGGLPGPIREFGDRHVEFELSKGALLVAERSDAPYFWIPAEYVSWWRSHPELGLPTSNPMEAVLSQEFEFGIATVTAVEPQIPKITVVDSPSSDLPAKEVIRDRILRQADGTSWYVTTRGQRKWIPDGGTWECAGGREKALDGDIASYAISSLPFAGEFRC